MSEPFPKMFRYKPRQQKLEMGDEINGIPILDYITMLAGFRHPQNEAAALLGVSPATFKRFLADHEEGRDAWWDGRQLNKASLRRLLWRHAQSDPATARALAKHLKMLNDDSGKGKGGDDPSSAPAVMSRPEAKRRILELQSIMMESKANTGKSVGTALVKR